MSRVRRKQEWKEQKEVVTNKGMKEREDEEQRKRVREGRCRSCKSRIRRKRTEQVEEKKWDYRNDDRKKKDRMKL